jgi:sulfatase modifying factor 1
MFATSLVLLMTAGCASTSGKRAMLALELESHQSTFDGCSACGCRLKGLLEAGNKSEWWISFGLVRPVTDQDWDAVGSPSHCGHGAWDSASGDFHQSVGTPYLVAELAATADDSPGTGLTLQSSLSLHKLTGFDTQGLPIYSVSEQKRTHSVSSETEMVFPLFIADQREQQQFAVHDVLLSARATLIGHGPAVAYGSVSVVTDVPGVEIFLDDGFVGWMENNSPFLLSNVPVGAREIRARDFSGREASLEVVVNAGKSVMVSLDVLDLVDSNDDLAAIGKNEQGHREYWRSEDGAIVVHVPAGEFLMGSTESEGQANERPQRNVHVADFLIDNTEVTWRQFRRFSEATGASLPKTPLWGTPGDYPISFISWPEALGFCKWVGGRLPTEAEWEKAARGTEGNTYPWGNQWDGRRCNSISGGPHRPESAGSYPGCISVYGVLDQSGSMWEWTADPYEQEYKSQHSTSEPGSTSPDRPRTVRGGGWMSQPLWLRTAYRYRQSPVSRKPDHGFRCAQDVLQ